MIHLRYLRTLSFHRVRSACALSHALFIHVARKFHSVCANIVNRAIRTIRAVRDIRTVRAVRAVPAVRAVAAVRAARAYVAVPPFTLTASLTFSAPLAFSMLLFQVPSSIQFVSSSWYVRATQIVLVVPYLPA